MNRRFKIKVARLAVCLAFPVLPVMATEPYPALPVTLSSSVAPNVLLFIDNSGSMADPPNASTSTPKMTTAKSVSKALIKANPTLRWGLFTFDPAKNDTSGILRAPVGSTEATLDTVIESLSPATWTPLGETMVEITNYWAGAKTSYKKDTDPGAATSDTYTSPIQYRCQKNFTIIVTDGVSTKDNLLPGPGLKDINGKSWTSIPYTSYDSSDKAVSKNFAVCTGTDSNVAAGTYPSCPAKIEGYTGALSPYTPWVGTTDDSTSRGRSLRDVAAYAYDRDFRVGGTDLDGKSWDDPKFLKQNVSTYTVGFAVDPKEPTKVDTVLQATAIVGGGKSYAADSETVLASALGDAVSSIIAATSNAGGVATLLEAKTAGNNVYQPVFNPNGWYGEVRCYGLASDGSIGAACSPNPKAVIPDVSKRKLYTDAVKDKVVDGSGTVAFDFTAANLSSMTSAETSALGATATERTNVINFLRGTTVAGYRDRPSGLLGDIVDSQPAVIGAPSGVTPDPDFPAFQTANKDRGMVFIGANDGMLHAFGTSDMTEIMGYIPSAVYPHLKALTATDYGKTGGPTHTYHVNGGMREGDLKASGAWKTILVGGLGQGGRGFFGIDATKASNFTAAGTTLKWEWSNATDGAMGYSFGTPIIYNVRTSATTVVPAVILPNGYADNFDTSTGHQVGYTTDVSGKVTDPGKTDTSALYVIEAATGKLLTKITLPAGSTGLSSPAGVDVGQDGILDYVYAGDLNGNLWRFDLTASDPASFKVIDTPIFKGDSTHPIVMRPAVLALNDASGKSLGNLVFFGTGKLLVDSDRSDTTTQTFYGVLDKLVSSPTSVTKGDLQEQTIDSVTYTITDPKLRLGTYRKLSANDVDLTSAAATKLGWFIDMKDGERLVTSPMLYADKLLFGTGNPVPPPDEHCLPGGVGWVMGVNPLTGSVTTSKGKAYSFIDINLDSKSSELDQIAFSSGTTYASGFKKDGIPTELTYLAQDSKIVTLSVADGGLGSIGQVIALREANMMAVYTANGGEGVKTGTPIGRPASEGIGWLYSGTIGKDTIDKDRLVSPVGAGVKIETTIWREIK